VTAKITFGKFREDFPKVPYFLPLQKNDKNKSHRQFFLLSHKPPGIQILQHASLIYHGKLLQHSGNIIPLL